MLADIDEKFNESYNLTFEIFCILEKDKAIKKLFKKESYLEKIQKKHDEAGWYQKLGCEVRLICQRRTAYADCCFSGLSLWKHN